MAELIATLMAEVIDVSHTPFLATTCFNKSKTHIWIEGILSQPDIFYLNTTT